MTEETSEVQDAIDLQWRTMERAEEAERQRDRLVVERNSLGAQVDFLRAHVGRMIDRLAGAKLEKGDFSFEGAAEFVNAERGAVNSTVDRIAKMASSAVEP